MKLDNLRMEKLDVIKLKQWIPFGKKPEAFQGCGYLFQVLI